MAGPSFRNGGSHPTFGGDRNGSGGGSGTIDRITSVDGSVVVTNPTGPITDLSVGRVANVANFDWIFSYGHGDPGVDDQLPVEEGGYEMWLSPTDGADIAEIGQVREWVLTDAIAFLGIIARIDAAQLNTIGPIAACRLVITKNGVDTAISVAIPLGATTDLTLQTSGPLAAVPGDRIGVAFETDGALDVGSSLRTEVRLKGTVLAQSNIVLAPAAGPRFWFKADVGVTRTLLDVTGWADQSGNGFNAAFSFMPVGSRHLQYNAVSQNGLPGLTGTQGLLAQGLASGTTVYAGGAPRTVFAVIKFGGLGTFGSSGGYPFTFRRSAPEFACGVFEHGPPDPAGHQLWYTDFNAPTNIEATVPVDYSGQSALLRWQTDVAGTHLSVFKGGAQVATLTNVLGGESGNAGFIIGNLINDDGHAVFEGDINEIIGYDGVMTPATVAQTEAYLLNKWGV